MPNKHPESYYIYDGVKEALGENIENPLGTSQGQIVVSASEDNRARSLREGILKIKQFVQVNPIGGVWGIAYIPTAGHTGEVYEIRISTKNTTAINIGLVIIQGIVGEDWNEISFAVCDKSPLVLDFPFKIGAGGSIQYKSNDAFTGSLYFSAIIIEKPLVV